MAGKPGAEAVGGTIKQTSVKMMCAPDFEVKMELMAAEDTKTDEVELGKTSNGKTKMDNGEEKKGQTSDRVKSRKKNRKLRSKRKSKSHDLIAEDNCIKNSGDAVVSSESARDSNDITPGKMESSLEMLEDKNDILVKECAALDDEPEMVHDVSPAEETFLDKYTNEYTWDSKHCGKNIEVNAERPNVLLRKVASNSTDGARGSRGYTQGRHVFQLDFNNKPWGSHCMVGVCTRKAQLHSEGYIHLLGSDKYSWGWNISSCSLHHKGKFQGTFPRNMRSDEIPRTFSMILDLQKGTLSFDFGGGHIDEAFTDIQTSKHLFPAVALVYGLSQVTVTKVIQANDKGNVPKEVKNSGTQVDAEFEDELTTLKDECAEMEGEMEIALEDSEAANEVVVTNNESEATDTVGSIDNRSVAAEDVMSDNQSKHSLTTGADKSDRHDEIENAEADEYREKEAVGCDIEDRRSEKDEADETGSAESAAMDQEFIENEKTFAYIDESAHVQEMNYTHVREPTQEDLYGSSRSKIATSHIKESEFTDVSVTEAQPTLFTYQRPVLQEKVSNLSMSSYYGKMQREESDAEEEPEMEYSDVSGLSSEESEIVTLAHGWDYIKRGGLIQPHPHVPNICVPMPNLNGKVQSIRGKRGFVRKQGRHVWRVCEVPMFPPAIFRKENDCNIESSHNDVIIGVASSDYRTFNHGFGLHEIGKSVWGYEPSSKLLWHDNFFHSSDDFTGTSHSSDELGDSEIDLKQGLELELDTYQNTLTYRYQGQIIGTFKHVKGDMLYPVLLFNKDAFYPLEICYLRGPSDYLHGILREVGEMTQSEYQESIYGHRCLLKKSSSHLGSQPTDTGFKNSFHWGIVSSNAEISFMAKNVMISSSNQPSIAVAECSLIGGRHQVNFIFDSKSDAPTLAIGMVSHLFNKNLFSRGYADSLTTPYVIGNDMHSWLWDITNQSLYHAGRKLGRYPTLPDFNAEEYTHYRLTIDFGNLGYNCCSFSALRMTKNSKSQEVDLGIAFVNMADELYPSVVIAASEQVKHSVKMEYHAGSWTPNVKRTLSSNSDADEDPQRSRACAIL